jgi:hypothetical protein
MVHQAGERRANHIVGVFRVGVGCQQLPGWGEESPSPPASGRFLSSSSGSGRRNGPKETCWSCRGSE